MVNAYFFDSSALVKRYVSETGSAWVSEITNPSAGNPVFIARITWVELFSVFAGLQRENKLQPDDLKAVIKQVRHDLETQYQVVEMDYGLTEEASAIVQQYPLRAYDALQIAAALKLQPTSEGEGVTLTFVSADNRLLTVAQAEGIAVENPNNHG